MKRAGVETSKTASRLAIYPCMVLGVLVFSFMFIGDGLRDALDPRLRT
jgi:ABC-type dipeptide/oligopeptide/nickel transport system permease subunit